MHLISGSTLSNTVLQLYNKILQEGEYQASRNGGSTSLRDVTLEIRNPRSRHLNLVGRNSNIVAMIAETFWVMAGDDKVDPYLSYFLPRAPQYSDDGVTWHGAYGPRMYSYGQLYNAIKTFDEDGLQTRRSFVSIEDPNLDNAAYIADRYGVDHKPKDIPCNREIHFYVEKGNQFCTKVIQRSGDAIFGTGSINPFEFSFLHELMFNSVKESYPELELGPYRWHVTNAHLYDFSKSQAEAAVSHTANYDTSYFEENDKPLIGPGELYWKQFFGELVKFYTHIIENKEKYQFLGGEELVSKLWDIFRYYEVPIHENLLFDYADIVLAYICNKEDIKEKRIINISQYDEEFKNSLLNSKFVKFEMINQEDA